MKRILFTFFPFGLVPWMDLYGQFSALVFLNGFNQTILTPSVMARSIGGEQEKRGFASGGGGYGGGAGGYGVGYGGAAAIAQQAANQVGAHSDPVSA